MHESPKQRYQKLHRRGFAVVIAALVAVVALCFWQMRIARYNELFSLYFHSGVHGLSVGAPVRMHGQDIGKVVEIKLARAPKPDGSGQDFFAEVVVSIDSTALARHGGIREGEVFSKHAKEFIHHGLRGQLKLPSMLAAGLCVDLDFFPEVPATFINPPHARHPEIPTNFTSSSEFVDRANAFIETQDIASVPRKIDALRERIAKFSAFSENFDGQKVNAAVLATLEHANKSVDPIVAKNELAAINREISEIHETLVSGGKITREQAEKLCAALQSFSDSLKTIRESARMLRTQLSPELINQSYLNDSLKEISPFLRTIKDFLF